VTGRESSDNSAGTGTAFLFLYHAHGSCKACALFFQLMQQIQLLSIQDRNYHHFRDTRASHELPDCKAKILPMV